MRFVIVKSNNNLIIEYKFLTKLNKQSITFNYPEYTLMDD